MPPFTVEACSIQDAPSLACISISAFWTDPTWVLIWRGKTLEYVISQAARRLPHLLVKDRARSRHQKVVDIASGRIVGYARWTLPDTGIEDLDSQLWSEACGPPVSEEEEVEFEREYTAADWSYDHSLDGMDEPVTELKNRLMSGKNYLLLDRIAVHPDHWGQGAATMLIESGIRKADKLGFDIFILGMKAALGVYKRAGFKIIDQIIQDDTQYGGKGEYGSYFLVREATRASSGHVA